MLLLKQLQSIELIFVRCGSADYQTTKALHKMFSALKLVDEDSLVSEQWVFFFRDEW